MLDDVRCCIRALFTWLLDCPILCHFHIICSFKVFQVWRKVKAIVLDPWKLFPQILGTVNLWNCAPQNLAPCSILAVKDIDYIVQCDNTHMENVRKGIQQQWLILGLSFSLSPLSHISDINKAKWAKCIVVCFQMTIQGLGGIEEVLFAKMAFSSHARHAVVYLAPWQIIQYQLIHQRD